MSINSIVKHTEYLENIIDTVRESLVILNSDMRIISANLSFYKKFMLTKAEVEGKCIFDIENAQWDTPKLRMLLTDILPSNTAFNDYKVECDFHNIGPRIMYLNARKIVDTKQNSLIILLAIEDVTDRINAERALKEKNRELELALSEIKTLKGIVPICSFCKKIRDDKGYWEQVEVYVHDHSYADFSHSICPDCLRIHYPDLEDSNKVADL